LPTFTGTVRFGEASFWQAFMKRTIKGETMKTRFLLFGVIAALMASTHVHADPVDVSTIRDDYGGATVVAGSLVAGDGIDADVNDSFDVMVDYDETLAGMNSVGLTADVWFVDRGPGNPNGVDLTGFQSLDFIVNVDPTSAVDDFGQFGFFQVFGRNTGGYTSIDLGGGTGLNAGDNLFSVSLAGMDDARALTFQLYGGPGQNLDGRVTFSVVDVELISAIPEPGSLTFLGMAMAALAVRRRR